MEWPNRPTFSLSMSTTVRGGDAPQSGRPQRSFTKRVVEVSSSSTTSARDRRKSLNDLKPSAFLAVDRTHMECAWAFPKDAVDMPDFDPFYAVDFWDLTNRQDWAVCESVQRGLSSPHARPGPLAPDEDGVYQFVTRVARAYAGND